MEKYRFWDVKNKQMVYISGDTDIDNLPLDMDTQQILDLILVGVVGYIKMKWTGLKDRNGKEVFEGDIIKYATNSEPSEIEIIEVEKHEISRGFYPLNMVWILLDTIEVIGNKFDNPELLKVKK